MVLANAAGGEIGKAMVADWGAELLLPKEELLLSFEKRREAIQKKVRRLREKTCL